MALSGRTVREGLIVGGIAYLAVAVFYAAFDLLAARGMLFTVDLLGKAVFQGLRDPAVLQLPIQPDFSAVVQYNAVHLVLSLLIGVVVTALVHHSEARPSQAQLVFLTIVGGFVVTILGVGFLTRPIRPLLPWWSIVMANTIAVVFAGRYLLRRHPGIWQRLSPFG